MLRTFFSPLITWILSFKNKIISFPLLLHCRWYHAFQPRGLTIGSWLPVKRYKLCLDTLHDPMCTHRGESPSGARTPCDVTGIHHGDFTCAAIRVSWIREGASSFFFSSSYHLSCMCVTFGRMLGKLWINPEAGFFQGRNLESTSSQDPTRCWSCSAIKHEILSVGRWFIILLLLLGENMEIDTLKMGGNIYLVGFFCSLSLPANSWMVSRLWLFFILWLQ